MVVDTVVERVMVSYNTTEEEAKSAVADQQRFVLNYCLKKPYSDYCSRVGLTLVAGEEPARLALSIVLRKQPPADIVLLREMVDGRKINYVITPDDFVTGSQEYVRVKAIDDLM